MSLSDRIRAYDEFFSRMVSLIPAHLYHRSQDPVLAASKFYKHRRLPLEPEQRKLLSKRNMLKKYDPDYKGLPEDVEGDDEDGDPDIEEEGVDEDFKDLDERAIANKAAQLSVPASSKKIKASSSASDSLDGLKQRLQRRIHDLKNSRDVVKKKGEFPRSMTVNSGKTVINQKSAPATSKDEEQQHDRIRDELMQIDEADNAEDMEFAISNGKQINAIKDKELGKPGSKMKRLKRMAEEVEKKRQRLESYKSQGDAGKELYEKERWGDVIASASGDRSVIDGNKVKKAMKRIEKAKAKSSREWKARIEEVSKNKQVKQEKREQNILARRQGIRSPGLTPAKDNDKLSSSSTSGRAGFEGKKTDFLNKNKSATTIPSQATSKQSS